MAHIPLPKHVIAEAERRWANKLQEDIQAWTNGRLGSGQTKTIIVRDEHRTIPVTFKRGRRVKAPHAYQEAPSLLNCQSAPYDGSPHRRDDDD